MQAKLIPFVVIPAFLLAACDRTVEQQPNVRRLGVLAAHLQAVRDGLQADPVTLQARLDTGLHLPIRLMSRRMGHLLLLYGPGRSVGARGPMLQSPGRGVVQDTERRRAGLTRSGGQR
jgi:hypothetical protein